MGREWYFNWATKSSSKIKGVAAGGDAGKGGGRKPAADPPISVAAAVATTTGGCMNGVLHMFDFHQFQLCLYPHNDNVGVADQISTNNLSKHHGPTYHEANKGVEAPRNSLESLEGMVDNKPPSLETIMKQEKASRRDTKLKLVQAPRNKLEEESSPAGARTPSLVARLMGLDTLPESTTTTPRSSTCQHPIRSPHVSSTPPARKTKTRTPNSAETPRSSSSVRRKTRTNFIDQHRLSLEMNKENSIVKEMESSRPSCSSISTKKREGKSHGGCSRINEDNCRSPGYYARQIMKQVKETVSRRVGVDITNTVDQRDDFIRRDQHLSSSDKSEKYTSHELEQAIKTNVEGKSEVERSRKKVLVRDGSKNSVKKVPLKRLELIKNKKDEALVGDFMRVGDDDDDGMSSSKRGNKRRPLLSNDLFHGSMAPFVPFNKGSPCLSPSNLVDKKVVLTKAKPLKNQTIINIKTNTNTSTTTTKTMARLSKTPSHRRQIQEEVTRAPVTRADKRSKKYTSSILEFQYITRVLKCTRIRSFSSEKYQSSHDIDALVVNNMSNHLLAIEEEEEAIVVEIERHILNSLVQEMAMICLVSNDIHYMQKYDDNV